MNDKSELISGIYPKPKHENAPDFVIGKMSINIPQMKDQIRAWESANKGDWVNIDMKVSKAGKGYAIEDTWEPEAKKEAPAAAMASDDDLPF